MTTITKETFALAKKAKLFTTAFTKTSELELSQDNVKNWLRDNHNLHIEMIYVSPAKWMSKIIIIRDTFDTGNSSTRYDSYNDCLESALKVCLNRIIR